MKGKCLTIVTLVLVASLRARAESVGGVSPPSPKLKGRKRTKRARYTFLDSNHLSFHSAEMFF